MVVNGEIICLLLMTLLSMGLLLLLLFLTTLLLFLTTLLLPLMTFVVVVVANQHLVGHW